jgi:hypothetical protein
MRRNSKKFPAELVTQSAVDSPLFMSNTTSRPDVKAINERVMSFNLIIFKIFIAKLVTRFSVESSLDMPEGETLSSCHSYELDLKHLREALLLKLVT